MQPKKSQNPGKPSRKPSRKPSGAPTGKPKPPWKAERSKPGSDDRRPGDRGPSDRGQGERKPGERAARPGGRFEGNRFGKASSPQGNAQGKGETTAELPPAEVKLPNALVTAWRETLIKVSKLPPGTNPKDENRNALAGRILATQSSEISQLWETFTTERGELTRNLLSSKKTAAAYLGGFHLANAARVQLLLDRCEKRTQLKQAVVKHGGHVVWNDFGCGTGAIAQTIANKLLTWKPDIKADFHLTDTTATLLDIAELATKSTAPTFKVLKHKHAIETSNIEVMLRGKDHTLFGYSLGYVWNELKKNKRAQKHLLELFAQHIKLNHQALIVILEPANQVIARDAMELRNELVTLGYKPIYPCPTASGCPMLLRSRDWCFSEGTWTSPPLMQKIEKNIGIDRSRFSTAAYLFASPSIAGQILPTGKMPPVVVGRPQKISDKGLPIRGFEMLICDGNTLTKKPGSTGKNFRMRGQQTIS